MAKDLTLNIVAAASVAGAVSGLAQVGNAMKNTAKGMTELSKKSKELSVAQKELSKVDALKSKYVAVSKEFLEASKKLRELQEAYKKTGSSNTELANKIKQQEKAVQNLNKQKERQKHVFEDARSAIEGENGSLGSYKSQLANVNKELEKTNKLKAAQIRYEGRQEAIGKMKDWGDKQLTQGLGVAGALAIPVKMAVDVEESKADLKKIVNNAEQYYGKLREISERSSMSQAKVFEMAGALAQSGVEEKYLVEYTEQANKIAVAFDMDAAAAGNFLAKTGAQLNIQGKELFAYSNAINHMSDRSASRAAELTEISGRIGGIAKGAGVSKSALLGLGATLVSFNKTPEQASTGLKNFFGALTKGEASSKKATAAFKNMGIDVNKLAVDMQRDGEGTILRVLQKLKEVDPAKQGAIISTIFGEEAKSSVQDMVNNLDKVKANLKEAKIGFGKDVVDAEYNNRMNTPLNNFLKAKNKVQNSMVDLGNALMPTLTGMLEKFSPFLDKMSQFIQKNPKIAEGAMKTAAAFGAFKIGTGLAAKGLSPIATGVSKGIEIFDKYKAGGKGLKGLKTAFPVASKVVGGAVKGAKAVGSGVVKGARTVGTVGKAIGKGAVAGAKAVGSGAVQASAKGMQLLSAGASKAVGAVKAVGLALKAAFIANPVGMIIAAIIAVIAILVLLYNKCSWFRNGVNAIFKALGTAIKAVWNGIKSAATAVWNWIGSIIRRNIAIAKFTMTAFLGAVNAVWNAIKSVATAVWNAIKSAAMALWNGLKSGITAVGSFFKSTWEGIKGAAIAVWNGIKSAFDTVVSGLKSAITGVVNFFSEKWNGLKNLVSKGLGKVGELFGIGGNYTGTNYWSGGLTTVAERGAELIQVPGKPAFLAESEMLLNLPKGTRILNNSQTRSTLRDKVNNLRDRMSSLKGGNSYGGDNITININVAGNADTSEIERAVLRAMEKVKNRQKRVAIV